MTRKFPSKITWHLYLPTPPPQRIVFNCLDYHGVIILRLLALMKQMTAITGASDFPFGEMIGENKLTCALEFPILFPVLRRFLSKSGLNSLPRV